MTNASPLLCPGDLDPDDPPTLVWCSRMLSIPHTPKTGPGKAPVLQPFAFDPVFDLCLEGRLPEGQTAANGIRHRHYRVITATAEVLGVDRGRVYRWTKRGLTADQADVIAIMFGLHPCLIWPDWFAQVPGEEEIVAAELRAAYGDMAVSA